MRTCLPITVSSCYRLFSIRCLSDRASLILTWTTLPFCSPAYSCSKTVSPQISCLLSRGVWPSCPASLLSFSVCWGGFPFLLSLCSSDGEIPTRNQDQHQGGLQTPLSTKIGLWVHTWSYWSKQNESWPWRESFWDMLPPTESELGRELQQFCGAGWGLGVRAHSCWWSPQLPRKWVWGRGVIPEPARPKAVPVLVIFATRVPQTQFHFLTPLLRLGCVSSHR